MSQKEQIQPTNIPDTSPSLLDRFALDFEYNKTIQQVRRDTRVRTI